MYVESRKNGTDKPICRAGIEKRLVNRAGEGESGTNREKRWHTCITLCETGSGKLQCNMGSSAWSPVITWRGGGGCLREVHKGPDVCVLTANSCCYMAKPSTIW